MKLRLQPFKQAGTQMYVGVIPVADILDIAHVDEWRQDGESELGYQRAPKSVRIKKVARYLSVNTNPLMPTSVLLSYRGSLMTEPEGHNMVTVTFTEGESLWIVDGQHRLYGFERAIEELGLRKLKDYPLPVVIMETSTVEEEANQFRIINETMQKVRTDLARRILAGWVEKRGSRGVEEVQAEGRLWETISVKVMNLLNKEEDSPWLNRIRPPNVAKRSSHVVAELSFSTSLRPILTEEPCCTWKADKIGSALKEYWKAWQRLVPEAFAYPDDYVLLKSPGIFSLHRLARSLLGLLSEMGIEYPRHGDFRRILENLGECAEGRYWHRANRNGAAMAGSMKGFKILTETMKEHLRNAGYEIE